MSTFRSIVRRLFLSTTLLAGVAVGINAWGVIAPAHAGGSAKAKEPAAEKASPDTLILKSGKVVLGKILEETEAGVKMLVVVSGISAPTTYSKSEILEIKRGAAIPAGAVATEALRPAREAPAPTEKDKAGEATPEADPSATRLYVVNLKGRFGSDISETPLRRLFEDVDKTFNDLVPGTGASAGDQVVDPARRQQDVIVLKVDCASDPGFGSIFRTEELAPVIKEQIVDKGRRVIFWVKLAGGGASFLPWISPEIFFTSEGKIGGIENLDEFKTGDKMVDEKLISAFLGHAEGFAIKGGYGDHLAVLRAMIRVQNWLCVRFEGGKPVYLTHKPDEDGSVWTILSDDGKKDNESAGKPKSKASGTYVLEAQWAEKLGISRGTADTNDDLAFKLGVQRNYTVLADTKGQKIFDEWKDRLEDTVKLINPDDKNGRPLGKLWKEFREIQVNGDYAQRRKERGHKINILKQIRALVAQYAEVVDPKGQFRAQIDVQLGTLQLQAEQDARGQNPQGGGGDTGGGRPGGGGAG